MSIWNVWHTCHLVEKQAELWDFANGQWPKIVTQNTRVKFQSFTFSNSWENNIYTKTYPWISKLKRGHILIKLQTNAMGLGQSLYIITLNTCVDFQYFPFGCVWDTNLHAKTKPVIFKYKRGHNLVKVKTRVIGLGQWLY